MAVHSRSWLMQIALTILLIQVTSSAIAAHWTTGIAVGRMHHALEQLTKNAIPAAHHTLDDIRTNFQRRTDSEMATGVPGVKSNHHGHSHFFVCTACLVSCGGAITFHDSASVNLVDVTTGSPNGLVTQLSLGVAARVPIKPPRD